jgi:uncharacterized protein (TIGR00255 family)
MLTSMTGYGESSVVTPRFRAIFQINAVNSRFLDARFNHGHLLSSCENEWMKLLQERVKRGKVEIWFYATFLPGPDLFRLDDEILKSASRELKRAAEFCPVRPELGFADLLALKELTGDPTSERQFNTEETALLRATFLKAVDALCTMRRNEGTNLRNCLSAEAGRIRGQLDLIKVRKAEIDAVCKDKLLERARILLDDARIDQNRLYLELSLSLSRSDITEELERLDSHLGQFDAFLGESGPIGKKLDFLAQELLREANTIGSKVQDGAAARIVVEVKTGLEKIKEQIQNVE